MRMLRLFRSWRKYFFWGNTISCLASLLFASRLDTLIEQTGWVARIVLCILLILSVYSCNYFQKIRPIFADRFPDFALPADFPRGGRFALPEHSAGERRRNSARQRLSSRLSRTRSPDE